MKSINQTNNTEPEAVEFLKLITLICHLLTQYALYPCQPLAANISRHFNFLLNASTVDSLEEWQAIEEQYSQYRIKTTHIEASPFVSH